MGRHLGIDFSSILVDLGSQVGRQNRAKIDQKWHRKNDEKKKGNKMAKKSQFEIQIGRGPLGPDPQGGNPPNSGANPPPPPANLFFSTFLSLCLSLSLSLLSFSLSPLSWPVFACLVLSWLGFPSQLGFQNLSKFEKNRCQKAVYLGLQILIAFWSTLAANLDPRIPHDYHFYRGKTNFF